MNYCGLCGKTGSPKIKFMQPLVSGLLAKSSICTDCWDRMAEFGKAWVKKMFLKYGC